MLDTQVAFGDALGHTGQASQRDYDLPGDQQRAGQAKRQRDKRCHDQQLLGLTGLDGQVLMLPCERFAGGLQYTLRLYTEFAHGILTAGERVLQGGKCLAILA